MRLLSAYLQKQRAQDLLRRQERLALRVAALEGHDQPERRRRQRPIAHERRVHAA